MSRPNWFEAAKLPLFAGIVLLVAVTLFFLGRARRNPRMFIRKIDGLRAVDRAMQDAARAGRPVYYVMGIGAILAFTGLLIYILLTVATVFFGRSNAGKPMEAW